MVKWDEVIREWRVEEIGCVLFLHRRHKEVPLEDWMFDWVTFNLVYRVVELRFMYIMEGGWGYILVSPSSKRNGFFISFWIWLHFLDCG